MFFFGSGSTILPYLLYLALIWGVFLVNGIVHHSVKKEDVKISIKPASPDTSIQPDIEENFYFKNQTEKEKSTQTLKFFSIAFLDNHKSLPEKDFPEIVILRPFLTGCFSLRAPPV